MTNQTGRDSANTDITTQMTWTYIIKSTTQTAKFTPNSNLKIETHTPTRSKHESSKTKHKAEVKKQCVWKSESKRDYSGFSSESEDSSESEKTKRTKL